MTFTFKALFCLGLTLGLWIPVLTELLPKPILRVQSDNVVSTQSKVIFVCEGSQGAKSYCLYKKESLHPWCKEIGPKPNKKVEFSISKIDQYSAGHYHCYYQVHGKLSEDSDALELVVTGAHSKPRLSAQPSPVVSSGQKVTLQCVSGQNYVRFILTKEGSQKLFWRQDSQYNYDTGNSEAFFSVPTVTSSQRWAFRCYSYDSSNPQVWSEPSDILELLVSGNLPKPIIKVEPGSVVTLTSSMTIWCQGTLDAEVYFLYKEGSHSTWSTEALQKPGNKGKFFYPSVTGEHAGKYRCYWYSSAGWSEPSDTLELVVTGLSKKPSLLTHQGHILDPGVNLTLQCCSDINYDRFALYKVGGADIMQHTSQRTDTGFSMTNFTLGYVNHSTGGQYRCYGAHNLSSEWSASSDPLDILITGQIYDTPFLSVMPNSSVHSGENVTRMCWSTYFVDTFILSKEGSGQPPLRLKSKFQDQQYQSEFSMSAVTSTHSGTYRCYGSQDSSLYLLSFASAPVELRVSGPIRMSTLPPITSMPPDQLESYVNALIGVSVAFLLFLFILIFIILQRRHQRKFRKDGEEAQKEEELQYPTGAVEPISRDRDQQKRSNAAAATQEESVYASVEDMETEDGVELDTWKPPEGDPQGETYAQVKPSRLRRVEAIIPSAMSREQLNTKYEQAEEGQEVDSQATESEEPQDVTYAQLCSRTLRQGTAAPPLSQAGEAPEEPSVYAALATARPGAVPKDKEQ